MLRVMNLLEEPQSGSVRVFESRVRPVMPVQRHPRQPATAAAHGRDDVPASNLFPRLTAVENITLPLRKVKGLGRADAERGQPRAWSRLAFGAGRPTIRPSSRVASNDAWRLPGL